jgi:HK97 family phage major capsid protein
MITRSGAEALIPVQTSRQILQEVATSSVALRLGNRMPDMTSKQTKIPVMTGNITANFVSGDTGLKPHSNMTWDNVYITAEELAVIVPIPEAVLDDADYDIWGEVRPRIVEAFGTAIDAAVFHGTNKPDSWPAGIVPAAIAAGNNLLITNDLYSNINGMNGVIAKVEEQGIPVTDYIGALELRARLRSTLDTTGQPIFRTAYSSGAAGAMVYELNGSPVFFPENGSLDSDYALLVAGNFRYMRYAIRQDVTYKILDQASITDSNGKVILNLAQQDCVALRAVMRLGWALPKPVNPVSGLSYYPFAVLQPSNVVDIESAVFNVTQPVKAGTPQSTYADGVGYTGAISWSPDDAAFAGNTVYTATVVLTAASGYQFVSNFSKADVTGIPATSVASSVTVTRDSATQVTIVAVFVKTAA